MTADMKDMFWKDLLGDGDKKGWRILRLMCLMLVAITISVWAGIFATGLVSLFMTWKTVCKVGV